MATPTAPVVLRRLHDELAALTSLQSEVADALARVRALLDAADLAPLRNSVATGARARPVRSLVLDALTDLGVLSYTREISAYVVGRYDRTIAAARFGALAADEFDSYSRRDSTRSRRSVVRLCFALTAEEARPIKRLLGRSDWALASRIWGPLTGRAQHLKLTIRLCELTSALAEQAANAGVLRNLTATYARDLPVRVDPARLDYESLIDRANDLLREGDLAAIDQEQRLEAAERWAGLSEQHQLFGRPETEGRAERA